MNREEILDYIKYDGNYDKEVKKRLKKLIKKYHPDKNNSDKKTILTLYNIKKELENNSLKVEEKVVKEDFWSKKSSRKNEYNIYNVDIRFIERIINILKNQKKNIERALKGIYHRSFYYSNKLYSDSYEIGMLDIRIEELNDSNKLLRNCDSIDIVFLIILIILFILMFSFKSMIFLPLILILIMSEIFYIKYKYEVYLSNLQEIKNVTIKKNSFLKKQKEYEENIKKLKDAEIRLNEEKRIINNDIAYYSHELSKSMGNTYDDSKTYSNGYSYSKK